MSINQEEINQEAALVIFWKAFREVQSHAEDTLNINYPTFSEWLSEMRRNLDRMEAAVALYKNKST